MNRVKLICLALACVLLFCGCSSSAEMTESATTQAPLENTAPPTTAPVITEPKPMGYTLEELEGFSGLFYILEDGSFARYSANGFKMYAGMYDGHRDTLYIPKVTVDSNPILSQDDTIAIFYDETVYVDIEPIGVAGATVSLTVDDEVVILNPLHSSGSYNGITYYPAITEESHNDVNISLIDSTEDYLFGVPLEEIKYTRYFKRYDNIYEEQNTFDTFPEGTEMLFSVVEGTKVRQVTKEADYHYYIYGDYYTNYNQNLPWTDANAVPTVHGYAAVSLENVPAGEYVMIVSTADNRYWGTVLRVA